MPENETTHTRPESKELKVKVPVQVHVQLHSVKILTGRRISDVVTDALARYFAEDDADDVSVPPGLARVLPRNEHRADDAA